MRSQVRNGGISAVFLNAGAGVLWIPAAGSTLPCSSTQARASSRMAQAVKCGISAHIPKRRSILPALLAGPAEMHSFLPWRILDRQGRQKWWTAFKGLKPSSGRRPFSHRQGALCKVCPDSSIGRRLKRAGFRSREPPRHFDSAPAQRSLNVFRSFSIFPLG